MNRKWKEIISWVLVGSCITPCSLHGLIGSSTIKLGKKLVKLSPVLAGCRELAVFAGDDVLRVLAKCQKKVTVVFHTSSKSLNFSLQFSQ